MSGLIRLATVDDAPDVAAIYGPAVSASAATFELEPPSADEMARRIEETLRVWPWLVCERDGVVAGYAYAGKHHQRPGYRWSVNLSVYVDARCRRLGVATALYTSLLGIVTAQGHVNAYAGIALPNPASVALHEAVGFTPVGVYHQVGHKFGVWHDVGWWERRLAERLPQPMPPMRLDALGQRPGWPRWLRAGDACLRPSDHSRG